MGFPISPPTAPTATTAEHSHYFVPEHSDSHHHTGSNDETTGSSSLTTHSNSSKCSLESSLAKTLQKERETAEASATTNGSSDLNHSLEDLALPGGFPRAGGEVEEPYVFIFIILTRR